MPEFNEPKRMQAPESDSVLDELIHASIATYGEPAPDSELAQRILIRIAAEARPVASRRWLPWAVAVPIAACLIAFFTLFESRPVRTPASVTDQAHMPAQLHNDLAPDAPHQSQRENRKRSSGNDMRPHRTAVAAKAQSLPKLDVFPTPQPLTPAERALVEFTSRAPSSERKSLIAAQQQPDAPLTIAAIKIQPIELPELGTN
jgi:hypothetical protein